MRQWTSTLYFAFADQAEAQAKLAAAGITPADSFAPLGSFAAIIAPIVQWQAPPAHGVAGVPRAGFWTMMKLGTDWSGYAAATAALQPYAQALDNPDNVFAGDET